MRTGGIKIFLAGGLIAALAFVPSAQAVVSNGKTIPLVIDCSATAGAPGTTPATACTGDITLTATAKVKKKKRKTFTLASSTFSVPVGQTSNVSVPVSGIGRKALKKARKIKAMLTVTTTSTVVAPQTLTVKPKRKRK
jgi:uncharacterized protein (DUF2126 family)